MSLGDDLRSFYNTIICNIDRELKGICETITSAFYTTGKNSWPLKTRAELAYNPIHHN